MPFTLSQIRELRSRITKNHKDWQAGKWGDNEIEFMAKFPSMIDYLLEEREMLKKKVEEMVVLEGHIIPMSHPNDGYPEGYNSAIFNILALFEE